VITKNNINLHILKASGRLDPYAKDIEKIFSYVIKEVSEKIKISNIDIIVHDNPRFTIPELGIGGHTHSPDFVVISLDPKFPNFSEKTIGKELDRTLHHELNHVARWKTVGYGTTLLGALISEGLADHFEREITNKNLNPWSVALDRSQIKQMMKRAEKEYNNKNYNHNEWFFGSKEKGIPRWTGYTLGYNLVAEYLEKNPSKKPSQLHNLKAEKFIK